MVRRKQKKKWIKTVFILLLVIAAGAVVFLVWKAYFSEPLGGKGGGSEPSQIEPAEKSEEKEEAGDKSEDKANDEGEKKKVPQYDGDDPNTNEALTGAITHAEVDSGKLTIRLNIDQYVTSGKCTLALRRAGATIYSSEAPIIDSASTSTCQGFDVPTEGLGNGSTMIIVYINGDDKTGEITGSVDW